jgi:hypothetical protein
MKILKTTKNAKKTQVFCRFAFSVLCVISDSYFIFRFLKDGAGKPRRYGYLHHILIIVNNPSVLNMWCRLACPCSSRSVVCHPGHWHGLRR